MKKLIAQIRSFAGLITAVTVIAGATMFVNNRTEKNRGEEQSGSFKQVLDTLAVMQQDIYYNSVELSELNEGQQGIYDTLERMEDGHEARDRQIQSLAWGLRNIEQFTPVQFEEIMDEMLKKNERLELRPIALPGPSSILYEESTPLTVARLNLYR